jgi:hypothetical protein
MSSVEAVAPAFSASFRPRLNLVEGAPPTGHASGGGSGEDQITVKLSFRELVLIHKALVALRTLGFVERQDELLNDTIHLVDLALDEAI